MKQVNEFYKSKRWKMKREKILRRDNYLCRESMRFGRTKQADMVHHIYPLEEYPELALCDWNLISLNSQVHNTFHDRSNNKVVGNGKYWQRKFLQKFNSTQDPPPNEIRVNAGGTG